MKYSSCFSEKTKISQLTFGCGPLSGVDWGEYDVQDTIYAASQAAELGINSFDTADVYGLGTSEKLLSKALGNKRHDLFISTKFGLNWQQDKKNQWARTYNDASAHRVVSALEGSLRRLRLDAIPLYFVHWPDPSTPFEETAEALQKCIDAGKILRIGLSNFGINQIDKISKFIKVSAVQVQYSLIDRKIEKKFLDTCDSLDISVFTYGPLAQGLLTGKYDLQSKFDDSDCRSRLSHFKCDEFPKYDRILCKLRDLAKLKKVSMSQIALRWVIENPSVCSAIIGIKSLEQLLTNVGCLNFELDADELEF